MLKGRKISDHFLFDNLSVDSPWIDNLFTWICFVYEILSIKFALAQILGLQRVRNDNFTHLLTIHRSPPAGQRVCGCTELTWKQIYFLEAICRLIGISKSNLRHISQGLRYSYRLMSLSWICIEPCNFFMHIVDLYRCLTLSLIGHNCLQSLLWKRLFLLRAEPASTGQTQSFLSRARRRTSRAALTGNHLHWFFINTFLSRKSIKFRNLSF